MGLSKAERETTIRWDEDEKVVRIFSASPAVWRKLARLGLHPTRESKWADGSLAGKFYAVPLAEFRWGRKQQRRGNPDALRRAREQRP